MTIRTPTTEEAAAFGHQMPDVLTRQGNELAGHTLCRRCEGTGNELFSMYVSCEECGGSGIAVRYGDRSPLDRWWLARRERKRRARALRAGRDQRLEFYWRLSRWFGAGHCFSDDKDRCRHCDALPSDVDYEMRRVGPFRSECLDRDGCAEARRKEQHD